VSESTEVLVAQMQGAAADKPDEARRLCETLMGRASGGDQCAQAALRVAISSHDDPSTVVVLESLAWTDAPALFDAALVDAVTDPRPGVRWRALRAAYYLDDWDNLTIDRLLRDEDDDVRDYAFRLLEARYSSSSLSDSLMQVVAYSSDALDQERGVLALVRLEASRHLLVLAGGSAPRARVLALQGLVRLREWRGVYRLLGSNDRNIRVLAAEELKRHANPELAQAMLLSDDPLAYDAGYARLKALGWDALPQLSPLVEPSVPACKAIAAIGLASDLRPQGAEVLRRALAHGDPAVVQAASRELRTLSEPGGDGELAWQIDADSMR